VNEEESSDNNDLIGNLQTPTKSFKNYKLTGNLRTPIVFHSSHLVVTFLSDHSHSALEFTANFAGILF